MVLEELQLALTSARVDQRNFGLWINNWQIGQTLNALVSNQLPTGELVLRVGGQQITATADIPIQQGARLKLEVTQLDPVPTLRVLNPVASPAAANVGGTLQLLPGNSSGIASSPLANVVQALQTSQLAAALPPLVAESVGQLLKQVSRPGQLSQAEGLAAAVRESGVFLESGLQASAKGRPAVLEGDFKAGLFRALARVEAALARIEALGLPGSDAEALLEMKRELESGLGRITLHQLNSQPSDAQAPRHWQLEIPLQLAGSLDSLRMEIDREPAGGDSNTQSSPEDDVWRVKLQLEPKALGAVEISMQLQGDALALRFAAASDGVRHLIDAGLPMLVRALESHGITLTSSPAAELVPQKSREEDVRSGATVDVRA
ncbi:flagellar hook-length control protein FliK [Congregibacter variabilis]|uniref:Flagellar hook-length control protein FliK n=1 Tax=Congregibacter variabilis TaxID=3081200 RepID=A0ABZ0I2C2_9GAMM|nr:flagellar hook-length control protein FliK [Congregibacter sp. IMCC43200]